MDRSIGSDGPREVMEVTKMTQGIWSEDIPTQSELRRLKTVAEIRTSNVDKKKTEDEQAVRLCNYTDVYYSDSISEADGLMEATATAAEITRFRLRKGDVLITKDSESRDDIAVPAFVARDFDDVLCGYHLALVRPRPSLLDGRYLYYCYLTGLVADQFEVGANGITRYGLSQDVLGGARLPLPPLAVQKAIASFLDRETARIDTLIEKKKCLLQLLDEKRTALITRAVTKGIDPDVPMKDSGVEWLGEIPEGWEVVRLRYLCRMTTGDKDTQDAQPDGQYPFVVRSDSLERISSYSFEGEGILTSGDGAGVGKIFHHMTGRFDFHQRVYLFHDFRRILGRFLYHFLRYNLYKVVLAISAKSTVDSLRRPMLLDFPVVRPPIDDQKQILQFLERSESVIDDPSAKVHRAISLLQEYRTALISAAVTGKIDVRDEVEIPA